MRFRATLPADRDWLIARHAMLYAAENGFDSSFGPAVAKVIDGFLSRHDPRRERGWVALSETGDPLGHVLCVADAGSARARLRLFLIEPEARGLGLGRRMADLCLRFARDSGYPGLILSTHESHRAACAVYRRLGLRVVRSEPVRTYGCDLVEQDWTVGF